MTPTARRSNTGAQPTPIEETEPTSPPQPSPQPVEPAASPVEGEPQSTPEPTADELDARFSGPFGFIGRALSPEWRAGYAAAREEFDAAQRDDNPLSVWEAIAEVTRRIGHIAKDKSTESGERYRYRGIDDVFEALHPLLGDVGLVIMPGRMIEHRRETRATSKGGTLNVAMVRVRYRLLGPDGTHTSGEAWGEAHDSGDKATQKALSQAYKSYALQLFSIPTEASAADDPDRTNEPGRPFTGEEVGRASNAWQAAQRVTTVEELAGVRRRALTLLDVPVPMPEDGGMAPLSVLFDRRLTELDSTAGGQ